MLKVVVHGLDFYAYHGVPAAEREVGHRYLVDIEVQCDLEICESDDIQDGVDYAALSELMLEVSEQRVYHTIEALAYAYCRQVLRQYRSVEEITIEIVKPYPPAPMIAESAGVVLSLARE
jgi:dihydroneopterin aldolase